ncbi:hypothetical protein V9L17_09955 [Pseudarthrobacter sp. CCNWLW207]
MERRRSAVVVEVHPQWGLPDLIAFQQEYAELAQVNHGQIGGRHQGAVVVRPKRRAQAHTDA